MSIITSGQDFFEEILGNLPPEQQQNVLKKIQDYSTDLKNEAEKDCFSIYESMKESGINYIPNALR